MAKFAETERRLFTNVYICRKCKAKNRFQPMTVLSGKARCRKCGSPHLRPKKK